MALRQTAARGRRGRPWVSGAGNFAASLLMRAGENPAQRSFVAALGLYDAMLAVTGRAELFALKWPNDVLLSGRKLAGILLETGPGGTLVIGVGVNLAQAPSAADLDAGAVRPVSLLEATGIAVRPEEFLDLLAPAVWAWEQRLRAGGFEALRAAWLSRAARLGEEITARLPDRVIAGRFETLDAAGALVLATEEGRVSVSAAEIQFAAEVCDAARH